MAICIAIILVVGRNHLGLGKARTLEVAAIASWTAIAGILLLVEHAWWALPGATAMGLTAVLLSVSDLFVFSKPIRRTLTKVGLRIAFGAALFYTLMTTPVDARGSMANVALVQVIPAAWYAVRFYLDEYGANRPAPNYPNYARYVAEPGWYQDPYGGPGRRWFDGFNWR